MTLQIITSDALGEIRHGFFTRQGGASSGIFKGLNCGLGSSDQADAVNMNRARVADALEVDPKALVTVHQTHSTDAIHITAPIRSGSIKADAMVTATPGIALGALSADCQPVLFADESAGVIGAAHAGWRGAVDGILESTVNAMEELGAKRDQIVAVIGPTISQRAYEVGPEFLDAVCEDDPDNTRFFANGEGDRYQFDLPSFGLHRLRSAGIRHAEWTHHCTYSDEKLFYSYRRSVHQKQADYGRLIAAIRL